MESLSAVVRRLRLRAGLTQEELAERSGISVRTIRGLESGDRRNPRIVSVRQLANALDLPPREHEDLIVTALGTDTTRSVPPAAPVPRQLQAAPGRFTGRRRELSQLTSMLRPRPETSGPMVISVVGGIGGIGKTALVLQWAQHNANHFPDGQLFVNLRGFDPSEQQPTPPSVVVRGFLDALGVAPDMIPADLEAQVGLYRSLVAHKRMLIILDNARDTEQILPLLPGSPNCTVAVTSRQRLTGLTLHGAHPLDLDVLTIDDSRALLEAYLGPGRVESEPRAVTELLRCCGGLPLALSVVGARAANHPDFPLAPLSDELQDRSARLDGLDAGELNTNVRAVLSVSYHALHNDAASAFRLLGLTPGPEFELTAVASLVAEPVSRARKLLNTLEAANLVQQHRPDRYRMHDLVRLYAAELACHHDSGRERTAAVQRVLDYYLHTAAGGAKYLHPHQALMVMEPPLAGVTPLPITDYQQAVDWYVTEHANLLTAIKHADPDPTIPDSPGAALACRLADALLRTGDIAEAERVATATTTTVTNPDLLVDLQWTLTQCRAMTGRSAESLSALERTLTIEGIEARHRARLLVLIARTHRGLGKVSAAMKFANQALAEAETVGDMWAIGWTLHVLIIGTMMRGDVDQALPLFDRALAVAKDDATLVDLRMLVQINHAAALGDLDHYDQAIQAAVEVCGLAERLGSPVRRAQAHCALGEVQFDVGQWDEALATVTAITDDAKDPGVACCDHGIAALIEFHREQPARARRHLAVASPYAKRIGDRVITSIILARSLERECAGAHEDAFEALTACLTSQAEERDEMDDLLPDAVRLAVRVGDRKAAMDLTTMLVGRHQVPHHTGAMLYCRGVVDNDPDRLLAAADHYALARRPLPRAKALEAAATVLADSGTVSAARAPLETAYELYSSLGATRDTKRLREVFGLRPRPVPPRRRRS